MKAVQTIAVLMIVAGVVAVLIYFDECASSRPVLSNGPAKRLVKVAQVKQADNARHIRFAGVTRAVNRAKLAFTIGERLLTRPVEVGAHVEAGAVLATLDNRKISNELSALELSMRELDARISQVGRDRKRYETLVGSHASAKVQLEKVLEQEKVLLASRAAGEVRLREAKRMLKEAVLKAPFGGTVTEVLLEPGEIAQPGAPVVVLSGDGQVEIEIEVPESLISRLFEGMQATVDLPLARRTGMGGKIQYVGRTALGPGRLFPVVVSVAPEAGAAAGMTAEVVFTVHRRSQLSVPIAAVINPGGQTPELFRVKGGKAEKVRIEVSEIVGNEVTIRGPLDVNDTVVVGGHMALLDGDPVEVAP